MSGVLQFTLLISLVGLFLLNCGLVAAKQKIECSIEEEKCVGEDNEESCCNKASQYCSTDGECEDRCQEDETLCIKPSGAFGQCCNKDTEVCFSTGYCDCNENSSLCCVNDQTEELDGQCTCCDDEEYPNCHAMVFNDKIICFNVKNGTVDSDKKEKN